MSLFLNRIDSIPVLYNDFDSQLLQWLWVLVDSLNENIGQIQNSFNALTAPNTAILNESVTLTSGSPSFTVANGTIYKVGDNIIGTGIASGSVISSISGNIITLNNNATINGASTLFFVRIPGVIGNGILVYDTTNNVYVGMQNGSLVKFTTTAYP